MGDIEQAVRDVVEEALEDKLERTFDDKLESAIDDWADSSLGDRVESIANDMRFADRDELENLDSRVEELEGKSTDDLDLSAINDALHEYVGIEHGRHCDIGRSFTNAVAYALSAGVVKDAVLEVLSTTPATAPVPVDTALTWGIRTVERTALQDEVGPGTSPEMVAVVIAPFASFQAARDHSLLHHISGEYVRIRTPQS